MKQMVYRLGKRARFVRLRRLRFYKLQMLAGAGSLLVVGVAAMGVSARSLPLPTIPTVRIGGLTFGGSKDQQKPADATQTNGADNQDGGVRNRPPQGAAASAASGTTYAGSPSRAADCNLFGPKTAGLSSAAHPVLRKLAQYQQVCNGQLAGKSSFFAPTPTTAAQADEYAYDMAAALKEYAKYNIAPLVFLEPADANGNLLDLVKYRDGAYDIALDTYFSKIKAAGVSDAMMGLWVLLPEGNIPVWTSVDPGVFAGSVAKVAGYQKKHFPGSRAGILLDSRTYPSATSWSGGQYTSLLPYVRDIPKGLLDSFGLQGFPWTPAANESGPALYDPKVYLRVDLAAEAARSLGVSEVWLNTGSFSKAYAGNAARTVTVSATQRQTLLDGAVDQALTLKTQGFTVSIHLFAENKAGVAEGIDWSYWKTPGDGADTAVFVTFAHDVAVSGLGLWIFDA